MKHQYLIEVRGYELDSYGHVNNAVYLNYTEQARWKLLKDSGLLESFQNEGLLLVVTETNIRYMRELKLLDKVIVETSVTHDAPYLIFHHDIINKSMNLKAAKTKVKTLLIDTNRITQDIPEELLSIVK